jgi:hypothetical protein
MKIIYIINGFTNLIKNKLGILSKEQNELYNKRLDVCLKCRYIDKEFCSICGCYVYAKTKAEYDIDKKGKTIDGCPKKYW